MSTRGTFIVAFALGMVGGSLLCRHDRGEVPQLKVITIRDTVVAKAPAPTEVRVVRTDTVWLPRVDNPAPDTVAVAVAREQTIYATESYRAYVSGYRPSLDSLVMLRTVPTVVATAPSTRTPRLSVGLQAGYGLTPRGLQPYVGLGISYTMRF